MTQEVRKKRKPGSARNRNSNRKRHGSGLRRETLIGRIVLSGGILLALVALYIALDKNNGGGHIFSGARSPGEAIIDDAQGLWQASLGNGQALLGIDGNTYQIIYIPADSHTGRHSQGVVSTEKGNLVFVPQDNMKRPSVDGYTFYALGSGRFAVRIDRKRDDMIWRDGAPEVLLPKALRERLETMDRAAMIEQYGLKNPVFALAGTEAIVWKSYERP